jgi:hypothetical protein
MSDQKPKPNLSDLIRSLSRRERLIVGDGATTADVSVALCQAREAWDQGAQSGRTRVVRNPETTASDLLRKWRDLPDDDEAA